MAEKEEDCFKNKHSPLNFVAPSLNPVVSSNRVPSEYEKAGTKS
jgi:hypothetical protein